MLSQNKSGTVILRSVKTDKDERREFYFANPVAIVQTKKISEVCSALQEIDAAIDQGYWVAGYISYDAGFAFENKLQKLKCEEHDPLLQFGVYDAPQLKSYQPPFKEDVFEIQNVEFGLCAETYLANLNRIKNFIEAGDVYQVNYTDVLKFEFSGSKEGLFEALSQKQPVEYAGYLSFDERAILSISPELFFRVENGVIESKPMKGTAKRGKTNQEDKAIARWLANDEKNRAENLMIVDLIRNDFGRICKTGTVEAPVLFEIEKYATLFQMTSTVRGELKSNIAFSDIFKSIFPCGSITGAPKIRAMQIINELEQTPRGLYTGAIGFISPKKEACFSVAIRTAILKNEKGEMGIGSGITIDSCHLNEYEECLLKSKFLTESVEDFSLVESIKFHDGYCFLDKHLTRLKDSADYFDYNYDEMAIDKALMENALKLEKARAYKVRLTLDKNGNLELKNSVIEIKNNLVKVSAFRTNSQDKFFYHKTTRRSLYDNATEQAQKEGLADFIFLNERGEVSEGAISNVFIEKDGKLFTPPISAGILAGVYRAYILSLNPNAVEKTLLKSDLLTADKIFICNAVRGMQAVSLTT